MRHSASMKDEKCSPNTDGRYSLPRVYYVTHLYDHLFQLPPTDAISHYEYGNPYNIIQIRQLANHNSYQRTA